MNDRLNMPCARVCLSRLSLKDLPPNALAQFYFYATERKEGSNPCTSVHNKEDIVCSSPYFVNHYPLVNQCGDESKKESSSNHYPLVNQCGDESKKESSSCPISRDRVHRSVRPSYSREHSRSITDRDRGKTQGSDDALQVPTVSNVNKFFGAVFVSPVTPVSCIKSCSTKDLNDFGWRHKTQEAIVDSRVNGDLHFSDLSAAVCLSPGEVSALKQEKSSSRTDGAKNLSTGKGKFYDWFAPVTAGNPTALHHMHGNQIHQKLDFFPTRLGHFRTQCASNNEGEERKDENVSRETQHSKNVTSKWGRSDSCYNNNAKKSKRSRHREDIVKVTDAIHSGCELNRPSLRVDYGQLSQGTVTPSSALEEDGHTQAGENMDLNFSASCSSWIDRTLYKDKCFWLQDGGSYSPLESRESSVKNSTNYFSSQENGCLELRPNKKTFDKIVRKEHRKIPPVEINTFHDDTPEQSTKLEAASTTLDNSEHLRNANASHLLKASRGLLTPEIKLVPVDIRGKTIVGANRVVHNPKHNLVVKIVDLGNNVHPRSKARHSSASQVKEQYTNFGRRIPNYCEVLLSKGSIQDFPAPDKRQKRKRKSQGRTVTMDTNDSVVKKENKQRKRYSIHLADSKAKIPKQYKNTKFSEIQAIPGIKMRYRVAFAKWPDVFTGALNTINQRIVSQNTLLHFLGKEKSI